MKINYIIFLTYGLLQIQISFGQSVHVKGKIIDENLNDLRGVIVTNLATDEQRRTGRNGRFEISASTGDSLVFQMVGVTDDTIQVKSNDDINLIMIDKSVNCLGAVWTERDYRHAYRRIDKRLKRFYKEADKLGVWNKQEE